MGSIKRVHLGVPEEKWAPRRIVSFPEATTKQTAPAADQVAGGQVMGARPDLQTFMPNSSPRAAPSKTGRHLWSSLGWRGLLNWAFVADMGQIEFKSSP